MSLTIKSEAFFHFWASSEQDPAFVIRLLGERGALPAQVMALKGCQQDPEWHPEGDALEHTACVCHAMKVICDREGLVGTHRRRLMLAALLHDTGKSTTTVQKEKNGVLRWTSPGHEIESELMTADFFFYYLNSYSEHEVQKIRKLVRWHMTHCQKHPWTVRAVRRLLDRLKPASVQDLLWLMEADCNGRPPAPGGLSENALAFAQIATTMKVSQKEVVCGGKEK